MARRSFYCYAFGRPGDVEAICVDLDIAVQGSSMAEVRRDLDAAIYSFIEDAMAESPEVAEELLSRRAPWYVRAKLALMMHWFKIKSFFDGKHGDDATHFEIPCHA